LAATATLDATSGGQQRFLVAAARPVKPLSINEFTRSTERCARLAAGFCGQPDCSIPSETIDRAAHAERTAIEDVRVHHRRAHVGVAQQLLHGPNVVAILE
jgi:hypothetical protein